MSLSNLMEFEKEAIEVYHEMVKKYYNKYFDAFINEDKSSFLKSAKQFFKDGKMLTIYDFSAITDKEQNAIFEMINHIRDIISEWEYLTPYELDDDKLTCCTSWKYEYSIFELVRLYKSFDWENNVLVFYGW